MKKNTTIQHSAIVNQPSTRRRKPISRTVRTLTVILLITGLLVSVAALIATVRPFVLVLPTHMFAYRHNTQPSYTVILEENPYFADTVQPAGQTYLREFTRSVLVRFDSSFSTFLSGSLMIRSRIDAVLKIDDASNASVVLLEKSVNLLPSSETVLQSGRDSTTTTAEVWLQPYQEMAAAFLTETGLTGNASLLVRFTADAVGNRYGQVLTDHQESIVTIPLLRDQFQITADEATANRLMIRPVRYLFHTDQMPLFVFPLLIGLFLVLLVLFLSLTTGQKPDHFNRDIKKMLRYARHQLLLIGDKAWEPEWCITASDFKSLVRTARKLKHPVFCYVNNDPEQQAAYFYVYYGENNYCYTFNGKQTAKQDPAARSRVEPEPEQPDDTIAPYKDLLQDDLFDEPSTAVVPLLPETDDTPDVVLQRINREPGSLPF